MEEVAAGSPVEGLYNGAVETAVRATVILNSFYPRRLDLRYLTWLDHLVVHTSDLGGPASLHPSIPQRSGELMVRRRLVEEGIMLARKLHLIDATGDKEGIRFFASDDAAPFVQSLRTSYGAGLRERADWLAQHVEGMSDSDMHALIQERIGRWALEFQSASSPGGALFT